MRSFTCLHIHELLGRAWHTLSQAERLYLEEHLARCGQCRREVHFDDRLRALERAADPALPDHDACERALGDALYSPGRSPSTALRWPPPARRIPRLAIGLVLAALGALLLWWAGARDSKPASVARPTPAMPADRVSAGSVAYAGTVLEVDDVVPARERLSAEHGATLELSGATVVFTSGSAIAWHPDTDTIKFLAGTIDVDLPSPKPGGFKVAAERFTVHVVGTRFRVESERVAVERGTVRVTSPDGLLWAQALGPGESWSLSATRSQDEPELAERREPTSNPAAQMSEPEPATASSTPASGTSALSTSASGTSASSTSASGTSASGTPGKRRASAGQWLDRARTHLAAGDIDRANRALDNALATKPNRRQAAETRYLRADCSRVQGHDQRAVRQYLEVADRYRKSTTGETALFAAARLQARSGRIIEAKKSFKKYLARYPNGQFRREAQTRLDILERP